MEHREVTVSTEVLVRMVDEAIAIGKRGTDGEYTSVGMIVEFVLMGRKGNDLPKVKPFHNFDLDVISEDDENAYHSLAEKVVNASGRRIDAVKDFRNESRIANGNTWGLRDALHVFVDPAARRLGKDWALYL